MEQPSLFPSNGLPIPEGVGTKVCKRCGEEKAVEAFSPAAGGNHRKGLCKPCDSHSQAVRAELKATTPYPDRNYKCPVCQKGEEELALNVTEISQERKVWCLDHDHKTDKFRGWLCLRCNIAAGQLKDDPDSAKRLSEYLKNA